MPLFALRHNPFTEGTRVKHNGDPGVVEDAVGLWTVRVRFDDGSSLLVSLFDGGLEREDGRTRHWYV